MIAAQPAARARLLLVDDESRILLSLKAIFRADYDVVTANGGDAALAALKAESFTVVVSDQRMPGMTGVEVLRTAREIQPQAIRILLTGYSDLNAIVSSINEGEIFRFVTKPWVNSELRETVRSAVEAASIEYVQAPQATPGPEQNTHYNGVGVLVLDDDTEVAIALRAAVDSEREVFSTDSVDAALEVLRSNEVGVMIVDMNIGEQSVTPLLGVLRQYYPALVVIVTTVRADASQSILLINHGQVFRLLEKPVGVSLLRGTVNIASRRHETLRQYPSQMQRIAADTAPLLKAAERSGLLDRVRRLLRWG